MGRTKRSKRARPKTKTAKPATAKKSTAKKATSKKATPKKATSKKATSKKAKSSPKVRPKRTVRSAERWIEPAARDQQLEAILDAALEGAPEDAFPQLLAYGATVDISDAPDDYAQLKPYARDAAPTREGLARIGKQPAFDLSSYEYPLESLEPGADWPESLRAKLWLLIARAYKDRYSDALLNLTARALQNAVGWFEVHEPVKAAGMHAWRARVLGYASYGETDILPAVDRARELLARAPVEPGEEYGVLVQLCEAIMRVRSESFTPHTRELFDLAVRGLELASGLAAPYQRSGLYHALAHALTHRADAEILDVSRAMRLLGNGADPLALAETAWQRAHELEDGAFYGEIRTDHEESYKEAYQRGLAVIALRRGDVARALELFDRGVARRPIYEQLQRTKSLMKLLASADVPLATRGEVLAARLRSDVLEAPALEGWDLEQATKYLEYAIYHLWNLGRRDATRELVAAIRARQGFAEAARAKAEEDARTSAQLEAQVNDLMRGLFGGSDDDASAEPTAEELAAEAAERAEQIANESPTERVDRVLGELAAAWLRDTRTLLLFTVKTTTMDATRATLDITVNVPEYALELLLADPVIARALAELDARIYASLGATTVERDFSALAIDHGEPPDPSLTRALSVARAGTTLAALGLQPDLAADQLAVDDPSIASELSQQRRRRAELFWS